MVVGLINPWVTVIGLYFKVSCIFRYFCVITFLIATVLVQRPGEMAY